MICQAPHHAVSLHTEAGVRFFYVLLQASYWWLLYKKKTLRFHSGILASAVSSLLCWLDCVEAVEPNLISGTALPRAGRKCAARFQELPHDRTYVVVADGSYCCCNDSAETKAPLNINAAQAGVRMQLAQDWYSLNEQHQLELTSLRAVFQA